MLRTTRPSSSALDRRRLREHDGDCRARRGDEMTEASTVLSVRHLSVTYGEGVSAVHAVVDVDLALRRGEILGLAGDSGSGKSTLAIAVTRILRPPGRIVSGEVCSRHTPNRTARHLPTWTYLCSMPRSAAVPLAAHVRGSPKRHELPEPGATGPHPARIYVGGAPSRDEGSGRPGSQPTSSSTWSGWAGTRGTSTRTSSPAACASE